MSKLTHEDKLYWKEATKHVKKSKLDDEFDLDDFIPKKTQKEKPQKKTPSPAPLAKKQPQKSVIDVDKVKLQAKLDLHGLRLNEAKQEALDFLHKCYLTKKKYVLIITGRSGKIKQEFEHWAELPEFRRYLRATKTAEAKHGGIGAYYLMLKKH